MLLIEWNENLSVGIDSIDQQHKQLIAIMNEIYDAIRINSSRDLMQPIVNRLIVYTETHFAWEEKHFCATEYACTAEHVCAHKDLKNQVMKFQKDLAEGKEVRFMELLMFLSDWLQDHIIGADKKYSQHLKEYGVV